MIKSVKKALTWYLLLNKRLFKKIGFIVILAMIPILAFSMTLSVQNEDSGMIRIAVVAIEPEDELVSRIMGKLENDGNVFVFSFYDSVDEAKRSVENKTVDAAWIFEEGFKEKVLKGVNRSNESLVDVYAVQDNIFFKASKEKIFSLLFPDVSYEIFKEHVNNMVPDNEYSEEQLKEWYSSYKTDEDLVEFRFLDSDQAGIEDINFLTSTIRGLLAVVMLLSGLAATMYFISDEKQGVYSWLTVKQRFAVLFANNFAALIITDVFALVALLLSDNIVSLPRDVGVSLIYVVAATAFCSLVGAVCSSLSSMAVALPLLLVTSLTLCPVFLNTNFFKPLQVILPPYLYLYAVNDLKQVKWMILYAAATLILAFFAYCFIRNKEFLRFKFKGGKNGN